MAVRSGAALELLGAGRVVTLAGVAVGVCPQWLTNAIMME